MPPLRNTRWERFAQALARGETQIAAHADAGYKADDANAQRLQARDEIRGRVAELIEEERQKHQQSITEAVAATAITKTWILSSLKRIAEAGMAAGDLAPANRALELLGKAVSPGMFAEHSVATVTNLDADLERMSPEELRAERERLTAEMGLVEAGTLVGTRKGADVTH